METTKTPDGITYTELPIWATGNRVWWMQGDNEVEGTVVSSTDGLFCEVIADRTNQVRKMHSADLDLIRH